jgi:hypothetical protein
MKMSDGLPVLPGDQVKPSPWFSRARPRTRPTGSASSGSKDRMLRVPAMAESGRRPPGPADVIPAGIAGSRSPFGVIEGSGWSWRRGISITAQIKSTEVMGAKD